VAEAAVVGSLGPRPDVVFASSPPLPVGIPGAVAARRFRRPLVFDVRDLWPEAAVAMGELTNPRLVGVLDRLARRLYRDAAAVTTTTEPFRGAIVAKGAVREKVHVLPNGTTPMWLEAAGLEPDRAELGLPQEPFLWTYAGTMNFSQALETALEAAELLGDGFHLHLVGEGPERRVLEARARELPRAGVSFQGQVPPAHAAEILRASDVLLMSLAEKPGLNASVPSKVYDYPAVGRPVLMAAGGEAARVAGEAGAALVVTPGDAEALASGVRRLREDTALRDGLVGAGRAFAEDNLRGRQVERLEAVLQETVQRGASAN
jgi:glycosyltransferase involved in cell wall biosynthesis